MKSLNINTAHHFGSNSRISDFIKNEDRALRVASALIESGAYNIDPDMPKKDYYTWKSGVKAPCYCNCRALASSALYRRFVAAELTASIEENFPEANTIIGLATAGISWAAIIANNLDVDFGYIRTAKKEHGVGGLIQGQIKDNAKIVLIDDLVASGGSLVGAMTAIKEESTGNLLGVQSIVNWGFDNMRQNLSQTDYCALTSYPYILTAAMMKGRISPTVLDRFLNFYENPHDGV